MRTTATAFIISLLLICPAGAFDRDLLLDPDGIEATVAAMLDAPRKIGISDDVANRLVAIHGEMVQKQTRIRNDLAAARAEFDKTIEKGRLDTDKTILALRRMNEIHQAYQIEMLRAFEDVRSILTAEQLDKACRLAKNRQARKKRGR